MQFAAYVRDWSHQSPSQRWRLRYRWIFEYILHQPVPSMSDEIPAKAAVLLWLGDLLEKINLTTEQIQLILPYIGFDPPTDDDTRVLAILDGRYMVYTNVKTVLDLETGETLETVPARVMENLAYDLNELYRRRMQGVHDADATSRSVE